MHFHEYDNGGDFHATVAMSAPKPFNFDEVWNYLQTGEQPNFEVAFDNIAVLKKEHAVWVVDRVFDLSS